MLSALDWRVLLRLLLLLLLLVGYEWDLAPPTPAPPLLPPICHVISATAAAAATWSC